jgi:uncharacterized phage protein gp47/JayE
MSIYDSSGIRMDPYADVKSDMDASAKIIWGDGINLDFDSFIGGKIELVAQLAAQTNQIVQSVYDAFRVTGASGVALDSLLALIGEQRLSDAYSTVTLTLTATNPTTVTQGSLYSTESGITFATDEEVVFVAAGDQDVEATCTIVGENNAGIGEVNQKRTTVYGITSVTNAAAAIPGRIRETDPEARIRHSEATATSGENDIASIFQAVSGVEGVSSVYIDNDTANGRVGVSVIGGSDDDIATAISDNLTAGVGTYGTSSVVIYNETTRQSETINFTRASNVPIYITMTITGATGLFPDDGTDQIRDAISEVFETYEINTDVVYTSLYAPIYSVDGVTVNSLYIGASASPTGTSDIPINESEKATISDSNILITVL